MLRRLATPTLRRMPAAVGRRGCAAPKDPRRTLTGDDIPIEEVHRAAAANFPGSARERRFLGMLLSPRQYIALLLATGYANALYHTYEGEETTAQWPVIAGLHLLRYLQVTLLMFGLPADCMRRLLGRHSFAAPAVAVRLWGNAFPEETFQHGKVDSFSEGKGFGFIVDDSSKQSYFVHFKELVVQGGKRSVEKGMAVRFKTEPNGDKGLRAVEVTDPEGHPLPPAAPTTPAAEKHEWFGKPSASDPPSTPAVPAQKEALPRAAAAHKPTSETACSDVEAAFRRGYFEGYYHGAQSALSGQAPPPGPRQDSRTNDRRDEGRRDEGRRDEGRRDEGRGRTTDDRGARRDSRSMDRGDRRGDRHDDRGRGDRRDGGRRDSSPRDGRDRRDGRDSRARAPSQGSRW